MNQRAAIYALSGIIMMALVVFNINFKLFWRFENGLSELGRDQNKKKNVV
jgi:hypothetical protein